MDVRETGQSLIRHITFPFSSILVVLKQAITSDWTRERLQMSATTPDSLHRFWGHSQGLHPASCFPQVHTQPGRSDAAMVTVGTGAPRINVWNKAIVEISHNNFKNLILFCFPEYLIDQYMQYCKTHSQISVKVDKQNLFHIFRFEFWLPASATLCPQTSSAKSLGMNYYATWHL